MEHLNVPDILSLKLLRVKKTPKDDAIATVTWDIFYCRWFRKGANLP
jgi:hypothetical protein